LASAAGGQRTCTAAAFSTLKKYRQGDFFNNAFGITIEKEAAYAGTGIH